MKEKSLKNVPKKYLKISIIWHYTKNYLEQGLFFPLYLIYNYSFILITFNNLLIHTKSFISLVDQVRNISQRKNTSDSNVKLLADHNFYHISNKQQHHLNGYNHAYRENINIPGPNNLTENTHSSSSSRIAFKVNPRPYEPSEIFKYNNKYRRGLNSSSNSLISLNESSASPNEDLNHTNSETNLIRSNPDLNIDLINQKKSTHTYSNQSPKLHSPNTCHVSINNGSFTSSRKSNKDHHIQEQPFTLKKDIQASYSNNASLNLSIHTAEEFSIEMLSWLKNETNGSMKIKADDSIDKIDNATLV